MKEGATPKLTTSASESSSTPNSELVFVRRASAPSRPSKITASTISQAAAVKFPSVALMMATKPLNRFIVVKRLGITERVTRIATIVLVYLARWVDKKREWGEGIR